MSLIPGWNSVAGSHWWSNFYFWGSIGALILLGVAEIVSHRYGERKDELTAIEQDATKRAHETEIAALHRDTARLTAEAESAKAQIATAQEAAAKANERTAKAELDLARLRSETGPRTLNRDRFLKILAQGQKGTLEVVYAAEDQESALFALSIRVLSEDGGWTVLPKKAVPGGDILGRLPGFGPNVRVEVRSLSAGDISDQSISAEGWTSATPRSLYVAMAAAIMRGMDGGPYRGVMGNSDPSLPEGMVRVTVIPR